MADMGSSKSRFLSEAKCEALGRVVWPEWQLNCCGHGLRLCAEIFGQSGLNAMNRLTDQCFCLWGMCERDLNRVVALI